MTFVIGSVVLHRDTVTGSVVVHEWLDTEAQFCFPATPTTSEKLLQDVVVRKKKKKRSRNCTFASGGTQHGGCTKSSKGSMPLRYFCKYCTYKVPRRTFCQKVFHGLGPAVAVCNCMWGFWLLCPLQNLCAFSACMCCVPPRQTRQRVSPSGPSRFSQS